MNALQDQAYWGTDSTQPLADYIAMLREYMDTNPNPVYAEQLQQALAALNGADPAGYTLGSQTHGRDAARNVITDPSGQEVWAGQPGPNAPTNYLTEFVLPAAAMYFGGGMLGGAEGAAAGGLSEAAGSAAGNLLGQAAPMTQIGIPAAAAEFGAAIPGLAGTIPAAAGLGGLAGAPGGLAEASLAAPTAGPGLTVPGAAAGPGVSLGGVSAPGAATSPYSLAGPVAGGASVLGKLGNSAPSSSWIDGISNGALLNVGGNLLSGLIGSNAAGNAADAQLTAGREANALAKEMYYQNRADLAPWRDAGGSAISQIQALLKDPATIAQQPDYKFGLQQGVRARDNSASANGSLYSGQQMKGLTQFGNDYGNTKLNESYNRLANIAGLGQTAAGTTVSAGQNYSNQAGNNLTGMGNAQGSAYVGQANAWSNALGNALAGYQEDSWLDEWKRKNGLGGG